jgi:predicted nucleic acid-binding protein
LRNILPKIFKIYLDACCLNRPFDDQNQDRIRLEAESVLIILRNVRNGFIRLIGSDILKLEIDKTPNPVRKSQLKSIEKIISKFIRIDEDVRIRAQELQNIGFSGFDSFHIASAEKGKMDAFLTTDDKLLKLYKRHEKLIEIKICNPLDWIQEFIIQ